MGGPVAQTQWQHHDYGRGQHRGASERFSYHVGPYGCRAREPPCLLDRHGGPVPAVGRPLSLALAVGGVAELWAEEPGAIFRRRYAKISKDPPVEFLDLPMVFSNIFRWGQDLRGNSNNTVQNSGTVACVGKREKQQQEQQQLMATLRNRGGVLVL